MNISDVVLLYDIEEFCAPQADIPLTQTTHLFFRGQAQLLNTDTLLANFCARLRTCHALISINLSENSLTCWDKILEALSALPNLRVINIRNSNIRANKIKKQLTSGELQIIDAHSAEYVDPYQNFTLQGHWTKEEYTEFLLVGITARIHFPGVAKFSRKRFTELGLPFSVIVAKHKVFLLAKTLNITKDIDIYNAAAPNQHIRIAFSFSDADTQSLTTSLVKVWARRSAVSDNKLLSEVMELRQTQDAYGTQRYKKNYTFQEQLHGESIANLLDEDYLFRRSPALEVRVTRSIAIMLAVLMLHARGKIHMDIKPSNLFYVSDALVEVIDLATVCSCLPTQIIKHPHAYATVGYEPPEYFKRQDRLYPHGRCTDAYAVGVTLQQVLVSQPYLHAGQPRFDAAFAKDPFYADLMQYYKSAVAQIHGAAVGAQIQGLLAAEPEQRLTIDSVLEFFFIKYPDQATLAVNTRLISEVKHIQSMLRKHVLLSNWLATHFSTMQHVAWIKTITLVLNNQPADDLSFSVILFAQLIRQLCNIYVIGDGYLANNITIFCDAFMLNLLGIDELDSTTAIQRFAQLHNQNALIYEAMAYIAEQTLKVRDELLKEKILRPNSEFIKQLGLAHNQINALITAGAPLQAIIAFAIRQLDEISNQMIEFNVDERARSMLAEVILQLHFYLEKFGESHNIDLKPHKNPLLFSPPKVLVGNIARIFNPDEIEFAVSTGTAANNPIIFADCIRQQLNEFVDRDQTQKILFFAQHGINPLTDLQTDLPIEKCTNPFSNCWREKPYLHFTGCAYNVITAAMLKGDFAQVIALMPYVPLNGYSRQQLGFHLVVAARANAQDLVTALLHAEADLDCRYPVGKYAGYTAAQLAHINGFGHIFEHALSQSGFNQQRLSL